LFTQILIAILAIRLFYIGVVESSILDIIGGCFLLLSSAGMFYAAITGSSLDEAIYKWCKNRASKTAGKQ